MNTGVFDDLVAIADAVAGTGAWLHVDGAFGLWAAASPSLRHLVAGSERADSWATDAHKWLNVPYDCGIAFCAHPDAHREAMTAQAVYLAREADVIREPVDWTPEHSRRARAVPVYAALRQLGRSGVADLVERSCAHARRFAAGIAELPGCEVLNDVVLNQVLFRFADDATTKAALAAVQASGEAWMSGTEWDGRACDPPLSLIVADDRAGRRSRPRRVRRRARLRGIPTGSRGTVAAMPPRVGPAQGEALAAWGLWAVVLLAIVVTYARLEPADLYHVSRGGLLGRAVARPRRGELPRRDRRDRARARCDDRSPWPVPGGPPARRSPCAP